MEDQFNKRRRNLLVTSMLLIAIQLANVEILPSVSTSFVSIKIGDPKIIMYFLYIIHIYFIIRFFQNIPYESYNLKTLYFKMRMMYLARKLLPKAIKCDDGYNAFMKKEEETLRYQEGMYDRSDDAYYRTISPDYENLASETLGKREKELKVLNEIINQIEVLNYKTYRWQFPKGRYQEETNYTYYFSKMEVLLSYFVAVFTTVFTESFSKYQLPSILGIVSALLFFTYLFNGTIDNVKSKFISQFSSTDKYKVISEKVIVPACKSGINNLIIYKKTNCDIQK